MTQAEIQQLFQQRYNQTNWKKFIGENFPGASLYAAPTPLTGINDDVATEALHLGHIVLNEGGIDRTIAVYEVTLAPGIVLERNRVGLRNLLRKFWKSIDGAFIVYHRPENPNWRFTYVSELTDWDEEGDQIKVATEPKRYTYVLGEGESVRTAAERFALLAAKGAAATLDDVKEAFSVEKLSKAFFDEYKRHYQDFCDYLLSTSFKKSVFNGDEKAIRDFSKKLLGRIVFLYFIQKKGWLGVPVQSSWGDGDKNFLDNLFAKAKHKELFYSELLSKMFFDTLNQSRTGDLVELVKGQPCRIPFLNGGLFEEEDKKHRTLVFPENLFANLFGFFNQYNFTIYEDDPNDHTVAVDPEMLGHIFENLLEDNKDKGAFYTPKEIVHYMCQESLIEYLSTWFENKGYEVTNYIGLNKPEQVQLFSANECRKGQLVLENNGNGHTRKIDRSLIEKFLKKQLDDADKALVLQHRAEFETALDTVKICDPAIGSGAFPMGLLHEIFTAKQTLYTFEHGNTQGFDASGVKLNIIQNSIYGVDIECGAVDIARLRFWLSLIVDEPAPKALPNLDYKIVVGNSLVSKLGNDIIEIDWEIKGGTQGDMFGNSYVEKRKEILQQISQKQKAYFNPKGNKKQLTAEIRNLKIDLLVNQLELMIKESKISAEPKQISFKSKAKYTEAFNLYLQTVSWKNHIANLKVLKSKPEDPLMFFDWKLDFPEVMNEQVADRVGFDIVIGNPPYVSVKTIKSSDKKAFQNKYSSAEGQFDLYGLFIEQGIKLLKERGVLSMITSNTYLNNKDFFSLRKLILTNTKLLALSNLDETIFETAQVDVAILILKKESKGLDNFLKVFKNKTEFLCNNSCFIKQSKFLNENLLFEFKLNCNPVDFDIIDKLYQDKVLLKDILDLPRGIEIGSNSELIEAYNFKDASRLLVGRDVKRFTLTFNNRYIKFQENNKSVFKDFQIYKQEKLLIQRIRNLSLQQRIVACYDDQGFVCTNTLRIGIIKDKYFNIKFILSLLNSKVINYLFLKFFLNKDIYAYQLEQIPIPKTNEIIQKALADLVDKVQNLKTKGENTNDFEQKIDNLVYKLYELSYEEVKVINPEFRLNEAEYSALDVESTATV